MHETDNKPWYRQFWPWFVMAPPALAVIGGLATLYVAGAAPSLVVADYGRIAMATEQRLERDRMAQALGLAGRIDFSGASGDGCEVRLELSKLDSGSPMPERLSLQLVHPTLSEYDRQADLVRAGDVFIGRIDRPAGRMYLSLTDPQGGWRLAGGLGRSDVMLMLKPRRSGEG